MSTKPYLKGPSGVLRADSKWLGVADLPWDRDTRVTIQYAIAIDAEKMSGNDPVSGIGLAFVGKKKQWKFGAICLATLNSLFTNEVENWQGKEILLYVDTSVMSFGRNTGGIRIRDKKSDDHNAKARELSGAAESAVANEPGELTEPSESETPAAREEPVEEPALCDGEWGETDDHTAEKCQLEADHNGACGPKEE